MNYDSRFNKIDQYVALLKAEVVILKWMLSFLLAGMVTMSIILPFPTKDKPSPLPPGGSEPPMELAERVANLEKNVIELRIDVTSIKQRLDSALPQLATEADLANLKTDVHKEFSAQTWKILTLIVALVLGIFGMMRLFPPKIEVPAIQIQYPPAQSEPSQPALPQLQSSPQHTRPNKPK